MSKSQTSDHPAFRRQTLNLAVLAACAALAQPVARAEILEFTGGAPVYTASWFNGSETEFHEFQFLLDWQGYCNAHIGATCGSATFWGVPLNWDANRVPGLADDVRTPAGSAVAISSYSSLYKGAISGSAFAGTLTANGQIRIGNGALYTNSGTIADLYMSGFAGSGLVNNGLVTVGNLSGAMGTLHGSGTTRVMAASAPTFDNNFLIKTGHTLEFYGQYGGVFGGSFGSTGPLLEPGTGSVFTPGDPGARLINYGTLDGASLMLQGSANVATLPRLVNKGTLSGGLNPSGVRVDNEGSVLLGAGGAMSFGPAGAHTGSFAAGVNSVLTFGGPWGHEFLPGSNLNSNGKVVFAGGVHKVGGSYGAEETEVGASVTFKGPLAHLPKLRVNSGSGELRFETPAAVSVGELTLDSGNVVFDVAPGSSPRPTSTVQTLILNGGTFNDGFFSGPSTPVNVVNPLIWNAGNIGGTGGVTALGGIEINATTALNRGLYGLLRNPGIANWHGGVINWGLTGTFENLAGATFNVHGDFSAGGGGFGRFVNAGRVIKTTGSGVAALGMTFDNKRLVTADAGTLRLNGGGNHDGGRFEALPGALIELSGGTVLKGAVTTAGRVDITGGSLTLLGGASFANAPGNSVNVTDLSIGTLAGFTNDGNLDVSGTLDNQGFFTHRNFLPAASVGAVVNAGTLNNFGDLTVLGDVQNRHTLTNVGSLTIVGGFANTGNFRNDGAASQTTFFGATGLGGTVHNEGTLRFQGTDAEISGAVTNLSQIRNGTGTLTITPSGSLLNHGSVVNDGGAVFVQVGGVLEGTGSYLQTDGLTEVKGVLSAAVIDIQAGLLRGGTPPGSQFIGTGVVFGSVNLGPGAQWKPGNSPGTFTVVGNATIDGDASRAPGSGNIEIEFDSPTMHDRIVVIGTVTLSQASVDLIFAPGFTATDGDSLEWLSAGQVVLPNGPAPVVFNVSGLSADWQAMPSFHANGASLEMVDLLAAPIPTSGSYSVPTGVQAYNGSFALLDELAVAGNLSNRAGGFLTVGNLNVEAGGRLVSRGMLQATVQIVNAGQLLNRRDGQFLHDGVLNTGNLVNEGQLSGGGHFVNQGGSVINRGIFNAGDFTNAAGGVMENSGTFTHVGQFLNEAGGRVVNRGTMTADGQIVNRGQFVVSGSLQNNASTLGPAYFTGSIHNTEGGTFSVEAGGTVSGPGTYFQSHDESVTRVNGTLAASDITIRQGVLTGSGTLVGPVTLGGAFGAGATVRPGNSPGTLTVDGNLNAFYTTFDIELAGPAVHDRVVVNGDASFTGSLVRFLLRSPDGIGFDYLPSVGDSFNWLTVNGAASGLDTMGWSVTVLGDGWETTLATGSWPAESWMIRNYGLNVAFHGDTLEFTAAPVPEPETWAMLLAGLGLVGWAARRRKASQGAAGVMPRA